MADSRDGGGQQVWTGDSGRSAKFAGLAALVLCLGWYCWAHVRPWPHVDDAYISYRYALNLVEGQGLVFNPGEYVEGITNLLWTLLISGAMVLGLDGPAAGHILGFTSGLAVLLITYWFASVSLRGAPAWWRAVPVFLVVASPPFTIWTSSGLETPLFTAAVTAAFAAQAAQRIGWATFALVIAVWTRPEGGLAAVVIYAFHLSEVRTKGARAFRPIAAFGGAVLLLTGFRLAYYGLPVPNTFFAKVGGIPMSHGVFYTFSFLVSGAGLLMIPAIAAAIRNPASRPSMAYVGVMMLYVVCIGGDAFGHHRFLLPVLPIIAVWGVWGARNARARMEMWAFATLLAAAWLVFVFGIVALPVVAVVFGFAAATVSARRKFTLGAVGFAGAAALVAILCLPPNDWLNAMANRMPNRGELIERRKDRLAIFESRMQRITDRVLALDPPPARVALLAVGYFGYHSRLPIVDLLGLTAPDIAHSRERVNDSANAVLLPGHQHSNSDFVLAQKPDVIILRRDRAASLPAEALLKAHPEFERLYQYDARLLAYRRISGPVETAVATSKSASVRIPTDSP